MEAQDGESVEVIAVVRLEENDLVSGVERGHRRGEKSAARPHGDHDLLRRIDAEAVVVLDFSGDAFAQEIDSFEFRVGGFVRRDGVARPLDQLRDRGKIADSLAEVDAADALAIARHAADLGLHQASQAIADLIHRAASLNAFPASRGTTSSASISEARSISSG